MTAVCPYCRAQIGEADSSLACESCGTSHHSDCYAENGGCTIFGCSKAPSDEPKLSVSAPELIAVGTHTMTAAETQATAPPPPPPGSAVTVQNGPGTTAEWQQLSNTFVPSIFGGFESRHQDSMVEAPPATKKSRTTFILLGALLGAFGAHNFYAGYKKKGAVQLGITLCTLGFAGPMIWVWAVIDTCTINQDPLGVQFET